MFRFVLLSALVAVAYAGAPLAPVLLPKVQVAPTQLNLIRQPHLVTHPEPILRDVPIPYKTVEYTAPQVVQPAPVVVKEPYPVHPVVQPVVHAARQVPYPVAPVVPAPIAPVAPIAPIAPIAPLPYAAPHAAPLPYAAPYAYGAYKGAYIH